MADILIKNMEMPPHCAYDDKDGNAKLCFMFKYCLEHGYNKINNCPLVALPEHGRLCDLDALIEHETYNIEQVLFDTDEVLEDLKNTPVIVEANNGTDN